MGNAQPRASIVERAVARIARIVVDKPKRSLLVGILLFAALFPGLGRLH